MATVPLYNEGRARPAPGVPIFKPAQAPRIPEQRISVDTSSLARAASEAGMQPKMPLDSFKGDQIAGNAWGAAAQHIGGLLGEVAERKAKIVQAGAMAEAELKMRSSFAEFQNEIAKNPDQSTWLPAWQKRAQALEKDLFGSGQFGPDAEAAMRLHFAKFAGNAEIEIAHSATLQEIGRAKQSVRNLVEDHVANGRFSEAAEAARLGLPQAGATPEEIDGVIADLGRKQKSADIEGLITTAPRAAFDLLGEADELKRPDFMRGLSAPQIVEYQDKATAAMFGRKRDLVNQITQRIKSSEITTLEQLQSFVGQFDPDAQAIDNGDLDHLRAVLEGSAPVNQDADWNGAYKAIKGLDFTGSEAAVMKQTAQLEAMIDRKFDGPIKAGLLDLLEKRKKVADSYEEAGMKTIADLSETMLKAGEFGAVTRDSEALAQKHSALVIPPTVGWLWKRPGTAEDAEKKEWMAPMKIDDPILRAAAEKKRREALQALEAWKDAQPVPPTLDQLSARWNEITGTRRAAAAAASVVKPEVEPNPLLGLPAPAWESSGTVRDTVSEFDRMMEEKSKAKK